MSTLSIATGPEHLAFSIQILPFHTRPLVRLARQWNRNSLCGNTLAHFV